ncbi:S-layer homology domain-containing protein [Paenibacillus sp. HN-1]|uniref:S-layer homology domain-containing protein n=1 Tax=Paenibacillus TaxID=44249 RepID=UPI001CA855C7|nr:MULTISPECIES: S-layer homology domain-containing protein [Paenibacillus]MBY9080034.1 S-layer homology domain-containing protein [Paenibacillus sp. CGMCC 1.18879]MBY9086732.1 S-layer homology domain-containing protein [Paenibacillus sinensis]
MFKKMLNVCLAATLALPIVGSGYAAADTTAPASPYSDAVKTQPYSWGRAAIVGGGYVPGVIFNQTEPGLVYARTDMGGAYRWDESTSSWKQLLDWVGFDNWNMAGVESLATDPVDPNRVYIAAGTYSNYFTDQTGVILRSTDKGETWEGTRLPIKFGGNMPGRNMGERLVIDPNDNRVIYFGARNGEGLWRSTDYGVTWNKVESFNVPQDAKDYYGGEFGAVWVTFDPSTGKRANSSTGEAASVTQSVYVGVADTDTSLYQTLDGGATWEPIPGQPKQGFLPMHGELSSDGMLYVTYNKGSGPYDGIPWDGTSVGAVWKYNTKTGEWTDITPPVLAPTAGSSVPSYPFGGLAVDPSNPNTIMVATMNVWWPDEQIFRSTDGGATWQSFWRMGEGYSRVNQYTIDYSLSPWLDWGKASGPTDVEQNPKLGWMIGDLDIDPFNPDHFFYGTGATLFGSNDLTNLDKNETVSISVYAQGIEETAVNGLIVPPSGDAKLISALSDIGGFRHTDLTKAPEMITNPTIGSSTDLDFAQDDSNLIVRVGNGDGTAARMGVSTDNGATWTPAANAWTSDSSDNTGGGHVAVSADGDSIVWSPSADASLDRPVSYSRDNGQTWTASAGIPQGAFVYSDRVNTHKFYGFSEGKFYVSTDGGATFSETGATGLPNSLTSKFKAVSNREGDIWLVATKNNEHPEYGYGVFHSTDSGESFTKLDSVEEAVMIGFGKAAEGSDYDAIYINGRVNGIFGFYRSDDGGASWIRINDDQHQYANATQAITGDPNVFGRVYIGANGFGIIMGDTAGSIVEPEAGGLTVTSADPEGAANDGKTRITVTPDVYDGYQLVYHNFGSSTVTVPRVNDTLSGYADLPEDGLIPAANGDHIGVAEINASGGVQYFGQTLAVVSNEPAVQPSDAPSATPTPSATATPSADGSGTGTAATPTPAASPAPSAQVAGGKVTITAPVGTDGKALAALSEDLLNQAAAGSSDKAITVDIKAPGATGGVTISLPASLLGSLQAKSISTVHFNLNGVTFTLDTGLLKGSTLSSGSVLQLAYSLPGTTGLSQAAKERIGSSPVYDLSLTVDGAPVSWQGRLVRISLPYTLSAGEKANQVVAYYLNDNGGLEAVKNSRYNNGAVTFAPKHFSKYAAASSSVSFTDTGSYGWAQDSIDFMAARGIVSGYGDGSFKPNGSVTRAEFLQMLTQALDLNTAGAVSSFTDVKSGAWYYSSVASAQKLGLVQGKPDGSFGPGDLLSRQDMVVMLSKALQLQGVSVTGSSAVAFSDSADISAYARESVAKASAAGLISGQGNNRFAPHSGASRAEASVVIGNLLQYLGM